MYNISFWHFSPEAPLGIDRAVAVWKGVPHNAQYEQKVPQREEDPTKPENWAGPDTNRILKTIKAWNTKAQIEARIVQDQL